MDPKSATTPSALAVDTEAAATREAFDQAERGELMTLSPECMNLMAETGEVPGFVRDPR